MKNWRIYVIFQTTVSIGILSFKIINQFELAAKGVKFVIFLSTGLKICITTFVIALKNARICNEFCQELNKTSLYTSENKFCCIYFQYIKVTSQ